MSYNGLGEEAPIRQLLEFMSDKWVPGMIYTLALGPQRPGELQRLLPGISKKMMIQTLRNMEAYGLVDRKVFQVVPPHVEYSLTEEGKKYISLLVILCDWAGKNKQMVGNISAIRRKARAKPKIVGIA